MNKAERIYYLDILNVISALAVVYLHVNGCFWQYNGRESLLWWKSANIIENVFYFAVPVFFMITGATLLDYNEKYGLRVYLKKRINKTVIPYFIWSLIGLTFNIIIMKSVSFDDLSVRFIVKGLIENTFVGVYWFFTALFCIYLSIPLLAAVEKENKIKVYVFSAILTLIINVTIPFFNSVFSLGIEWKYWIAVSGGYLFYVLVGYIISNVEIKPLYRFGIYLFAVAGMLTQLLGTYYSSKNETVIVETFHGYNCLPCILYSIGIFVFVKYTYFRLKPEITKFFSALSKYTFGVYLIHIFIVRGIEKYSGISNTNLTYRLTAPIFVFIISVFICWIIKKIPFFNKIIP